jgi:hypothetical protein
MDILDTDRAHRNLSPYGEPQLGTRGLYPTVGGQSATEQVMAMLWLLSYSDGAESLLDIAQRSGLEFAVLDRAARDLVESGLLEVVEAVSSPGSGSGSRRCRAGPAGGSRHRRSWRRSARSRS